MRSTRTTAKSTRPSWAYPDFPTRLSTAPGGGGRPPPNYLMAEMVFDSLADADAALTSEAGTRARRTFATSPAPA